VLIPVVLIALGVLLTVFPNTAVVLSARFAVFAPRDLPLVSTVEAQHVSIGLVCLALGLFIVAMRFMRRPQRANK
jgi:cytochrome b561